MPILIKDDDNKNRIGNEELEYFIDNVYRFDMNGVRLKDGTFTSVSKLIGKEKNPVFTDFFGQIEMDLKKAQRRPNTKN